MRTDGAQRADAAALWAELRHSLDRRFDESGAGSARRRALAQRRLLRALELRWKLEELVLLPALQDSATASREDVRAAEKEIGLLRELSDLIGDPQLPSSAQGVVLAVLEGIATLRSDQLERRLRQALQNERINGAALAGDIEGMLERWCGELLASGDIEDEEADPVGQPPR
ncbi:hypothetical protein [Roseateles violae]|uniref:Uncharacterized protein n=1 Tax=Roseateles violae TaxID=3058042 RepID=A0ABT8DR56_9BURK|nr:hypothetical protein [Pelomonas sp. PFR6]MDN3920662.1 hypothetical protein [Pelomonas sp. PFR6]